MKSVMMLDLGDGVSREVAFITSVGNAGNQVMIEIEDERPLSKVAADFEGCETIVKTDNLREGVKQTYEGYTEITSIQRNAQTGTVRVMLKRT